MLTRTIEERVTFNNPFKVPGQSKLVPAGSYRINITQELLEGLTFLAYRKTLITLYIPKNDSYCLPNEHSIIFEPQDFEFLLQKDKAAQSGLYYRIKTAISENKPLVKTENQELLREIERGENEGMYIPTSHI